MKLLMSSNIQVYQDEDGVGADGEGEDEDDGDLPPEDEGDLDYYPDSEAVEEEEEERAGADAATPGPEHRGRFHPQYAHLAQARPGAHPHKKPGTEALNAARAAAEEAAAEAAAASGQKAPPQPASRHKREIGVERPPVLEESYGVAPNGSEGLRLYETLTPMPAAPARPARTHALPQPPRQQLFSTARTSQVVPPPADAGRVVRVYQDQAPAALRSGAAPRLKKKSAAKKTLGSLRDGEEAAGAGRSAHALRRRPVFAAHYGGDASSYKLGSTSHFEGNGKLRHPTQVFVDWSPASWMGQLNMDKKFNLQDGAVTVADSGLYFVYAQIHYLDRHDTNGFSILVNNASALQCTVTAGLTGGGAEEPRSNTCFTAGAMYLGPGDQVSVREVGSLRWTLFQPQKSFFGLVKLGHTARIT
ncbi:Protein eiger [Gryllus bimaculatus]|nr:Protein eiger [Gryllus bimaculatus]